MENSYKEAKKVGRKLRKMDRTLIGKSLLLIPDILEITNQQFYDYLQQALYGYGNADGYSVETRNYIRFGIPAELTCERLEETLEKILDIYAHDESINMEKRLRGQKKWEKYSGEYICLLKGVFQISDKLQIFENDKIFEKIDDCLNAAKWEYFKSGDCSGKFIGITESQDQIRESLRRAHPKSFLTKKQKELLPLAIEFMMNYANYFKENKA